MIAYLIDFATKRQLAYKQDSTGNMVIKRPGSGGGEDAPVVVIQVTAVDTMHLRMHHVLATQAYMSVTAFNCDKPLPSAALCQMHASAIVSCSASVAWISSACIIKHALLSMHGSACIVLNASSRLRCSACIVQHALFGTR